MYVLSVSLHLRLGTFEPLDYFKLTWCLRNINMHANLLCNEIYCQININGTFCCATFRMHLTPDARNVNDTNFYLPSVVVIYYFVFNRKLHVHVLNSKCVSRHFGSNVQANDHQANAIRFFVVYWRVSCCSKDSTLVLVISADFIS